MLQQGGDVIMTAVEQVQVGVPRLPNGWHLSNAQTGCDNHFTVQQHPRQRFLSNPLNAGLWNQPLFW